MTTYKWNGCHQRRQTSKQRVRPLVRHCGEHLVREEREGHAHQVAAEGLAGEGGGSKGAVAARRSNMCRYDRAYMSETRSVGEK